jgi:hypothetical protein
MGENVENECECLGLSERSKNDVLTESVLSYIGNHYEKHNKTPSIKLIIEKVVGLNRRNFYEIFPGGISETCEKLGIPAPSDRIAATRRARQKKRETPQRVDAESLNTVMRFLGEPDPQKAMKLVVKIVADYSAHSIHLGIKNAAGLGKYYDERHDQDIARNIELTLENDILREHFYYTNDEELMDVLDVPTFIRIRFNRFKLRQNMRGDLFLRWLFDNFKYLWNKEARA